MNLPSKEDARLCASVIKELVETRGLKGNHQAIATLTITVAKLYNKGVRERDALLAEVVRTADIAAIQGARAKLLSSRGNNAQVPSMLSMEPEDERGHSQH
jgi:hypothetical protein